MPSPPAQSGTPPDTSAGSAEPAPLTGEPLAKRAKPNPPSEVSGSGSLADRISPTTTLPFDPAHPMASNDAPAPGDRPSLPSMASLMSPDPNVTTLPAPPNTAAFPPGGPGHHPSLGLGLAAVVPPLSIKLLTAEAKAPTRGSAFAAGYDLYAAEATSIPKGGRKLVSTGIACAVPPGTYARVAPRSGLAVKHGIATGAGVVDEDYRGEVKVVLFNHGDEDFAITVGDRIAQMVLERIVTPDVLVVEQLEESVRGAGGFGSTGGFGSVA